MPTSIELSLNASQPFECEHSTDERSKNQSETTALSCELLDQAKPRAVGPNEALYKSKYADSLNSLVKELQRGTTLKSVPNLRFSSLNGDERRKALDALDDLLSKLGIKICRRSLFSAFALNTTILSSQSSPVSESLGQGESDLSSILIDKDNNEECHVSYSSSTTGLNHSIALLSLHQEQNDRSDVSSVENPRLDRQNVSTTLLSPEILPPEILSPPPHQEESNKKRFATSSAKKGKDTRRLRRSDHNRLGHSDYMDEFSQYSETVDSPSPLKCSSIMSLSPVPRHESPSTMTDDIYFSNSTMENVVRNLSQVDKSTTVSSPHKFNDSILFSQSEKKTMAGPGILGSVRLKEGAFFRMKPLMVHGEALDYYSDSSGEQRTSRKALSKTTSARVREKIRRILAWLIEQDQCTEYEKEVDTSADKKVTGESRGRAVVLSLTEDKVMELIVRLVRHASSDCLERPMIDSGVILGNTLIVLCTKDDTEHWESKLRSGTTHSVLNHSKLKASERKSTFVSRRCAGFGIVLSTYDAIKTKEKTLPLDEEGRAILGASTPDDGWYMSRGNASQKCEQLSTLHRMFWRRIVFVDSLGRKSFLTKIATSRYKAAVALNGAARFVFYPHNRQLENYDLERAFKKSTKCLNSISSVLHLQQPSATDWIANASFIKDLEEL